MTDKIKNKIKHNKNSKNFFNFFDAQIINIDFLAQIVLCRNGKCVDLYYKDEGTNIDFLECESLKEKLF